MPWFCKVTLLVLCARLCKVINKRGPVNLKDMINFPSALCTRLDSGHISGENCKYLWVCWDQASIILIFNFCQLCTFVCKSDWKNCGQRIFPACHHGHSFGHSIAQCYLPIDKSLQKWFYERLSWCSPDRLLVIMFDLSFLHLQNSHRDMHAI